MTRPGSVQTFPTIASNTNYPAGAQSWAATPTKVDPAAIAATGLVPGDRPPAQWLNWLFWYLLGHANYLDSVDLASLTEIQATEQDGTTELEENNPAIYSTALLDWDPIRKVWWYAAGLGGGGTTGDLYYSNNLRYWHKETANIPVSGSGVNSISGIAVKPNGDLFLTQYQLEGADAGVKVYTQAYGGAWSGFIDTAFTSKIKDVQYDPYGSARVWLGGQTSAPLPLVRSYTALTGASGASHACSGSSSTSEIRQVVPTAFGILACQFGTDSSLWRLASPYSGVMTRITSGLPSTNYSGLAYDPVAAKAYLITSAGVVYMSTNGTSWAQVADLPALAPYPGTIVPTPGTLEAYGGQLAVAVRSSAIDPERTILASRDHGVSWRSIGHPFRDLYACNNIRRRGGRWVAVSEDGDFAAGPQLWT